MNSRKSKILVVDDNQNQADLTARKLSKIEESTIEKAYSGEEASEKIKNKEFDCIVSDYNMEDVDGLELYEVSKKHAEETPFILFTGKGSETVASKAITKGVTDYIRKEGTEQYDKLKNRCEKALNTKKVEEELRERKTKFKKRKNILQEFHEITNSNKDFQDKINLLLKLGTDKFGLKTGILSRIEGHDYYVEEIYTTSNQQIEKGQVFELSDTFCQTVKEREQPVSFNREYSDKIEKHPAYEKMKLEVYLGVPVYVEGELYGTFNFSSDEKIGRRLDDEEKTIVRIMTEWIGKEIARQRRRREAEAKQKRLRQVIDNLPQLVFAKDEEGEFILANEAVAEVYGTTVEELEGSTDSMFAESEEEVENFRKADNKVIDSGETKKIDEEKLTTAQGEKRILQTTKIPYNPVDSIGKAVLGVSHDVTDRKEREQSLEKILDASREMSKAKNADEIANVAVRTMEKALKMKLCSMHEYKSSENIFKPLAASDKANQILEDMVLEEKSSLAGEAFNKEESRIYEDLEQISEVYNPDSVIKSEIIIPVGDYGILISGSKQKRYFGQGEVYLAELLASITKASLERAERETKIREREKELEMKSSAMESTMDGIAIADEDGEYIYMNEAHAQMFGKSTEFFMGKSWMSLYADDEAERIKEEVFPVLEEEGQWMGETVGVKQDGTEIVQEITLTFMDDGKLICTNRDITDKKKSKRELEEKNKRLDEFNSIISHDLRNPLNVAMGYLDLYREEGEGEDLEKIENSLERIKNIIDELMAVSSNSEEMQKEKVSLEKALVKAISHRDEEIDYNVFKDVEVYISSTGLVSMFENLLSNSIKHNNPPFEVEVGSTDKGFYYTDNGELEEDKEHVEEYGFTTHNDGSGIGVSIIMRIAQVNNWNVELSRTGDGSLRYDFDTSKASD